MSINRKVSARELRRTLVDSEAAIREALVPAVQMLEHNDQVSRARLGYRLEAGPLGHQPTLNQCRRLAKRLIRAVTRKGLKPKRTRIHERGVMTTHVGHVAVVTQYRIDRNEFFSMAVVDTE